MSHPDPLFDYYDDYYHMPEDETMDDLDSRILNEDLYDDESMDGDHDSGMTSAGWGTDEDYGFYGEDF